VATRKEQVEHAVRALQDRDAVLRRVIEQAGPFTLRPERDRFWMLVRSIISQQISVKAARSIRDRLIQLAAPEKINPEVLLRLGVDELRTVGISPQKARYLLDLASRVDDGTVRLSRIGRMSDDEVIVELTQVTGIGRWTAEMFLMFALGRFDVFPVGDLGVRNAMKTLYSFDDSTPVADYHEVAETWKPFRSVASWYCWRSLEIPSEAVAESATGFPS
jgi:DNA-3-methyladenine glycosylase II